MKGAAGRRQGSRADPGSRGSPPSPVLGLASSNARNLQEAAGERNRSCPPQLLPSALENNNNKKMSGARDEVEPARFLAAPLSGEKQAEEGPGAK